MTNEYEQMGKITLTNLRSYSYTKPSPRNPNITKTHKGYTATGRIEGLEGIHEVIACERYTKHCERLIENVTLNTRLVFNSLKTSNSVIIKEVL